MSQNMSQQYDYDLCSDAIDFSTDLSEQFEAHRLAIIERYSGLHLHIDSEQDLVEKSSQNTKPMVYRIDREFANHVSDTFRKRYLEKITLKNLFQHVNGAAWLRYSNPKSYHYDADLWVLVTKHHSTTERFALRFGFLVSDIPKPLTLVTILRAFCETAHYYQHLDYVFRLYFTGKFDDD